MNLFELFIEIDVDDKASGKVSALSDKLGNGLKTAAKIGVAAVSAATTAVAALTAQAVNSFAEYEQLAGGAAKIFDEIDIAKILTDARKAQEELGLSATQYLAVINDIGATFAATMGDQKGYETARLGLQAISDYASGTGKNVDMLSEKFMMITRSAASYQSIADQFSGILPATSKGFLEQAQAAGILSDSYKSLTEVPIDEYQTAVALMLEKGVENLGLAGNTAMEAATTISGSLARTKAAWGNLVTGLADDNADLEGLFGEFTESAMLALENLLPVISRTISALGDMLVVGLPKVFEQIPSIIKQFAPKMLESGIGIVKTLISGIISTPFGTISSGAISTIDTLIDAFIELLPLILELGLRLIGELIVGAVKAVPKILSLGKAIFDSLVEGLMNVSGKIAAQGDNIVKWIKDGISKAWAGLAQWFNNLWDKLFNNRTVNVEVNGNNNTGSNGSHAGGFNYVPYNGYIAELHRGEAVLTASEARAYRLGHGSGGGVNITQNIYSTAKSAADLMQEALYQQERAVYLGV